MGAAVLIKIVDYGMGNLRSVQKALERLGYTAILTQNPDEIENADKLILPGVGAFGAAMTNLNQLGLVEPIHRFARSGKPFLGICLGMQLLLSESDEQGVFHGLDLIPGRVVKFSWPEDANPSIRSLKIPHMGWNQLQKRSDCPILEGVPDGASIYFVHSYYPAPPDDFIAATTEYGIHFCSVIWKDNIFATQFHPEKSGSIGLRMLQNFAETVKGE